jgi:HD-GYP domain-containing protein (c-di-GMP phosphodiesterase class II)
MAVADAYEAMTSGRPYRKAMGDKAASAEIERGRGIQFDPEVVDAFLRNKGIKTVLSFYPLVLGDYEEL